MIISKKKYNQALNISYSEGGAAAHERETALRRKIRELERENEMLKAEIEKNKK